MTNAVKNNVLITENYLLEITETSNLSEIQELQLHNLNLVDDDLKAEVFNKLINVVEINFSGNKLTCIPKDITLNDLQYLDMSKNCLKDVEFFGRFPNIKDLDIADNIGLTVEDSYKAIFLLKNLEFLNGKRVENKDKLGKNFTIELLKRIKNLWFTEFHCFWQSQKGVNNNQCALLEKFASSCKAKIRYGPNSLKSYRNWRINNILQDFVCSKLENPSLFFSVSLSLLNCKSNSNDSASHPCKRKSNSITLNNSLKEKIRKKQETTVKKINIDFQPLIFLQCHSKNDRPNDFQTQTWCCAFQPKPTNLDETTNTVATCGGSSVCIINCETAKVAARFKQDNEEFYTLAWTCVSLNGININLLVAAGCLGYLHLIHVDQAVCYGRIKSHSSPIQTIRFLSNFSTLLLSGDKKGNIYLIDIDTPLIPEYKFTWKKLMCFVGVECALLRFLVKDSFLFAGTEAGLYFWSEDDLFQTASGYKKISSCRQLIFPETDKDALVDAMEMLNDDIVATKCANQSYIFLWKHSVLCSQLKTAKSKKQKLQVSLIAKLAWSPTGHCFINFSVCKSYYALLVGDDVGKLWVYDLSSLATSKSSTSCQLLQPHITVPFPTFASVDICNMAKFAQTKTIYNDITCTSDLRYVVVASDNNMDLITKRTHNSTV